MAEQTIQLKGEFIRKERDAGGTITPGHLVQINSSGDFVVHSAAQGPHSKAFAIEDNLQGNKITDDYSSGQRTQVNYQVPGNEVNAILAAGENVAIGAILAPSSDGTLVAISGSDQQPVGRALVATNLSASAAVATLIKIEIM